MRSPTAILIGTAAMLAGCSVGPDYRPRSAEALGVPPAWSVPANFGTREDLTQWWTRFDDPLLQRLVASAATTNLDVAQAVARLRQARESLNQSRAQLLPNVGGTAGYSRNFNLIGGTSTVVLPDGTVTNIARGNSSSFSLGSDVSYQVGLFGEVRRTVEASGAQYAASGYDYASVVISSQSEIARNYILARAAQAQLANARSSLALQDDNLEIAGFRVQAGLVSSLDQEQARLQRAQTAASIPSIEVNYNAAVSRLGVLTGQAPGALKAEMAAVRPIPKGPTAVGVGIPAEVLRQRPDVLAAERGLAAATAQIGVAKAALYPALAISGNIATNATSLGNLFDQVTGGLFAGLTQLIFDGGRAKAQVRSNEAAAQGALAAYKGTVLTALEDVENAVVALRSAQTRAREFATALDAANNTAILSRSQYRAGLTDFTTLNQSESGLLSARNGLTQAQSDEATALVQLYLALGGGWDSGTVPLAPAPTPYRQDR
ncbi:efflux transporter outer membrane subunit [Sphingomonas donggukensis]|uniref:Efflux transporter outer membrane subunit n=1 Tax=Sphingomonas donggukensis TaxID=2949093 RepID=A0ABY4TXF1_9SPHN|nr:efflux transporter outer membrane subunit [Sphingomonas donggukensis]URW77078.1 efflux transporter outer membrane subunit [Sphingomonas donggukensis]